LYVLFYAIYVLPVFQNFVHSNSEGQACLLATRERFAKVGEEEEEEEEDRVQELHDGLLVCL
jgi:hypothetical protein